MKTLVEIIRQQFRLELNQKRIAQAFPLLPDEEYVVDNLQKAMRKYIRSYQEQF